MPTGEVRSAGAALAVLARMLPGGKPLGYVFRRFPRATDRGYEYIAAHRDHLAHLLRVDAGCKLRR